MRREIDLKLLLANLTASLFPAQEFRRELAWDSEQIAPAMAQRTSNEHTDCQLVLQSRHNLESEGLQLISIPSVRASDSSRRVVLNFNVSCELSRSTAKISSRVARREGSLRGRHSVAQSIGRR